MEDSKSNIGHQIVNGSTTVSDSAAAQTNPPFLIDLAVVVIRNRRLLILLPLLCGLVALAIAFLVKPTFTATTRIIPPQQQAGAAAMIAQQLGALAGLAGAAGLKNPADQYVTLLKSRVVVDSIIDRFKLRERYEEAFIEDVRDKVNDRVRVTSGSRDGVITIEVDDHDPQFAATMANAFIGRLQELTNSMAAFEAGQRRLFFQKQIADVKQKLDEAQTRLQRGGVNESILRSEPRAAVEEVARLRAAVTAAQIKISTMRSFLSAGNPDLRMAEQELASIRAQLSKAEGNSSLPSGQPGEDYVANYRNFKYQEALYELLAKQFELSKLDEAKEGAIIQVIDTAIAPEKKSKPKRGVLAVLTTLATFIILLAGLLVRDSIARITSDPDSRARLSLASARKSGSR